MPRIKSKTFQSSWPRALLMSTLKMEPEQGRGQEGSDWKLQNRGGRDSSDAAVISHIVQHGCRGQGSPKVGTTRPVEPLHCIDVGVLTFHFSLVSGKRRRGLRIGYLCSIFVRHRELEGVAPFNF